VSNWRAAGASGAGTVAKPREGKMRKYLLAIIGLVLLCLLAALGTASGSPDTITVDSTTDVLDADVQCDLVGIGDLPGPDKETSIWI